MAITPEQLQEYRAEWAANRARQEAMTNRRRFEAGEFTLELVRAGDDPPEGDTVFQSELAGFSASLRADGIPYAQTAIAMDALDAHGFPLPEFIVAMKVMVPPVITGLAGYAAAWVQARNGRKVRIKIGEVEAEASTIGEIEKLLEKAAAFQDRDKGRGA